jgi:predicted dehydrogenase
MLNATIVGLGRWGRILVDSVQAAGVPKGEHIRFTRAVARTLSKAEDYAAAQKLALGDDYEAVLADPETGAVVLATPHSQHRAQIEEAAAAGKHVFAEKPLTLARTDAAAAVAACETAGVVLAVGHNRRFLPAMHELKWLIDRGELGRILHIEGNYSGGRGPHYRPGMWRAEAMESPAGGMTGYGIHLLDAMIHLCGPLAAARATSLRQVATKIDDTTFATLRFTAGMTGYLSTLTATAPAWRLQVFGSKGWAHMLGRDTLEVCFIDGEPETRHHEPFDTERAELDAFAIAAGGGTPYPVSHAEAIQGVAALEAIVRSAERDGAEVGIG